MLQERRNEKIRFLVIFIIDQNDLAGGKAACECSEGVSEGHWT